MQLTFEGKTIDQLAIELIQAYEPPEGYYLGFSGGKDSVVIYDLTKRAGAKFDAHYSVSPIDPPEIRIFIKRSYPEVAWDYNSRGFFNHYLVRKGAPSRQVRWCCQIIKEGGGKGRIKILGMRSAESKRRVGYSCFEKHSRSLGYWLLPIVKWQDSDVWQYIYEHNLEVCSLYREGWQRIGCLLCPFAGKDEIKLTLVKYPRLVEAYKRGLARNYDYRINKGRPLPFQSKEEYFNWWIKR